jgi:hypothetical protein
MFMVHLVGRKVTGAETKFVLQKVNAARHPFIQRERRISFSTQCVTISSKT